VYIEKLRSDSDWTFSKRLVQSGSDQTFLIDLLTVLFGPILVIYNPLVKKPELGYRAEF
jgi:hypothetical protein